MTVFPALFSTSTTLLYTFCLKKIPLSGGACLYSPLWGMHPPPPRATITVKGSPSNGTFAINNSMRTKGSQGVCFKGFLYYEDSTILFFMVEIYMLFSSIAENPVAIFKIISTAWFCLTSIKPNFCMPCRM